MTRLLFVTEATGGGSPRSQRELARQLVERGHDVRFLARQKSSSRAVARAYDALSDASVRAASVPVLGTWIAGLRDQVGGSRQTSMVDGLEHMFAPVVANALPPTLTEFAPDVVVVNSVDRWAWRRIHAICHSTKTPVMLYVREDDSLSHLDTGAVPNTLLANAESLAAQLRAKGYPCEVIPSVVDPSVTATDSSRRAVLAINAVESRGGSIFWQVAERMPHVPFIMQESWALSGGALETVQANEARLPNVEFRHRVPPGPQLYGEARLLMVPYRVDNRPRVILEAQHNGIPVVVGDVPALVEAMGAGGVSVPLDEIDAWVHAIDTIWQSEELYSELVAGAYAQSQRPEVDPTQLTDQFEGLVERTIVDYSS